MAVTWFDYAHSEEIAPFRVTGVEGEVYVRYFTDEYIDSNAGVDTSRRSGATSEIGLDLTIHSYFYHPNFFRLDFGGGPVFVQHTYDSNILDYSDDDQYFNFHAKANILEKKPYPLMLYYDRHSSTTPYAVQDRMLLTSENYGLNFKLKRPLLPALVIFDLSHTEVDGKNLQRITDEVTDRASVEVSGDLGPNGDGVVTYSLTKNQSASGSVSFPIDETTRIVHLVNGRTEHLFGVNEWIRLTNNLTYKEQDNLPEREELRYTPNLFLTHSDNLRSYYRYSYLDRTVEQIDTTSHSVNTGITHLSFNDQLETNVDLHADQFDTEGLQQTYYAGRLNLSYLQPFDEYNIRYTGGWTTDYTDRVGDDVAVIGEAYSLDSLNSFELNNRNVIQSSIVIKNETGTQTYIEGVHYELITIVDLTRVQWIDLDDIPDKVVVDYSYESGGTAEFTSFRQLYRIDLNRGKYLRLFAKYRSVDRNLQSGDPTIPLNSYNTKTLGLNVDYPLQNSWIMGGKAEHENHDADLGSYRRDSGGLYLQIPKVLKGNLRVSADKVLVDNLESPEDVDLTRYGIRYYSRPWYRTTLTADLVGETDTGGTTREVQYAGFVEIELGLSET